MEGPQWVSLMAFSLKQSQGQSGLALKQGFFYFFFFFPELGILVVSPLCCPPS